MTRFVLEDRRRSRDRGTENQDTFDPSHLAYSALSQMCAKFIHQLRNGAEHGPSFETTLIFPVPNI